MADQHPLAPYPSPEQREVELHHLAGRLAAEVVCYGQSVEGRPLHALRLPATSPASAPGPAPTLLLCANIHGVEFIGNRVAHGLLEALIEDPTGLRRRAEVWVAPCLNPDGYARTWAAEGRGPLAHFRKNSRGVDLNRNFPMPWSASPSRLPFTGADTPDSINHRGEAPASEPEIHHLVDLLQQIRPHAGLNFHAFMGTLIQPPVRHLHDHRQYAALVRAFREGQVEAAGPSAWRYARLAVPFLDVFTGEMEDYQHHVLGCWAMCVEVFALRASLQQGADRIFWRFNPRDPRPWVRQDVHGALRLLERALALERPPMREGAQESRPRW